jgi:hypothetical protein
VKTTVSLSNKAYDIAKWCAQIGLPGLATLYFTIAQIWSLPYSSEVVGSITAFDAFLGVVLGISTNGDIDAIAKQETLTFKVNPS